MKDKQYSKAMTNMLNDLIEMMRKRIKIGKIVSVYDKNHPEYFNELFMVTGFQLDIDGKELVVALMDHEYKSLSVHVENIILKSLFTIDDMFPPRINNKLMSDRV